jgi:hypothetical protein
MNLKFSWIIFTAFALSSVPALADVSTRPDINYQVDAIIPGYSVRVMSEGSPLGRLLAPTQVKVSSQDSAKGLMSQEIRKRDQEQSDIYRDIHQATVELHLPGTLVGPSAISVQSAAEVSVEPRIRMASFLRCAGQALPVMKAALLAELKGRMEDSIKLLVDTDADRADESGVQAAGFVCGRFLGVAALPRLTLREEIKALKALSARAGDERQRLLEVFVLAHHRAISREVSNVWVYYWKRLSPEAALGKSNLPTVEMLEQELLHASQEQLFPGRRAGVDVTMSWWGDLPKARVQGMALSSALIQYLPESP